MREQIDTIAEQATAALAHWDADHLDRLGQQALALRSLLDTRGRVTEVPARLRVFAAVLKGAEENLRVLRRLQP